MQLVPLNHPSLGSIYEASVLRRCTALPCLLLLSYHSNQGQGLHLATSPAEPTFIPTMAIKGSQPPSQVIEPYDPLASLTAPPKNESRTERFRREQRELFAKHISDRIDEGLNGEKAKAAIPTTEKKQVRVLVLGHHASGGLFRFFKKFLF